MNAYLIISESYKVINEEVAKIISDSLNVVKYDIRKDSINDILSEANYFSLTGEIKYIIIKSDELFKSSKSDEEDKSKIDTKALEAYLKMPCENSVLIFTSLSSPDKRKKIYKLICEVGKLINYDFLNKKDMVYKCMSILQKDGYKIDYENANYIVENSFCNYDIMLSEIEKIKILLKPCLLTYDVYRDIVSEALNGNVYNYINAIINRKMKNAFSAYRDFKKLKIDPIMVFSMLVKEYQIMLLLKTHDDYREVQKHYHKEDWQMQNYLTNIQNYSLEELKKIIIKLANYDFEIKSGKLDKEYLLDILALELCD